MSNRPERHTSLRWLLCLLPMAVVIALIGAVSPAPSAQHDQPIIVATIPPLAALVAELAPNADIRVLLPNGMSAHDPSLRPADRAMVDQASLVVGIGSGFDEWLPLPENHTWLATDYIGFGQLLAISEPCLDHDHHHDHSHHGANGTDPHLWLDPLLIADLIDPLAEAVAAIDPAATSRVAVLGQSLQDLHQRIALAAAPHQGRSLICHHPSLRYWVRRYGLKDGGVLFDNHAEAMGARHQAGLAERAIQQQALLISEPQLDPRLPRVIAKASNRPLITLDPLGVSVRANGYHDWLLELSMTIFEALDEQHWARDE